MSIAFYNEFLKQLGRGTIDLIADDLRLVLVKNGYIYTPEHQTLTDVPELQRIATTLADLQSKVWSVDDNGYFLSADAAVIPLVEGGQTVVQTILYRNSATPSERYLIARYAGSGYPFITDGGNVTITFSGDRVLSLRREGTGGVEGLRRPEETGMGERWTQAGRLR